MFSCTAVIVIVNKRSIHVEIAGNVTKLFFNIQSCRAHYLPLPVCANILFEFHFIWILWWLSAPAAFCLEIGLRYCVTEVHFLKWKYVHVFLSSIACALNLKID